MRIIRFPIHLGSAEFFVWKEPGHMINGGSYEVRGIRTKVKDTGR
jgi:hypothetical protein